MPRSVLRIVTLLLLTLAACAGWKPEDVQTVGFWGLGWHFTGTQNRLQAAIPPVLEFLRLRYPGIRPAEPSKALTADFQAAVLNADARLQAHLDSRMIAVMTVTGLPCAAEAFPVRDGGVTVAAFLVLDAPQIDAPPKSWKPCPPVEPGPAVETTRAPALRGLLAALMNAAAAK